VSLFENAKITQVIRYSDVGHEYHAQPAGSVMSVAFEVEGLPFLALNGVSWQVVPEIVPELLANASSEKSRRAMQAILAMKRPIILDLLSAYNGG